MNCMATLKHIASKNSDYAAIEAYLVYQHDAFTGKQLLDEQGRPKLRESYLLDTLECGDFSFATACLLANRKYGKNTQHGDIKSHQYIISFDPRDAADNGLTMEKAQALGLKFCEENFPGHPAIVCTHPDGHNHSGNIHVHIVIGSIRTREVERKPYMQKPRDWLEGMKHSSTAQTMRHLRVEVMELCEGAGLYQIDLLNGSKERVSEAEYWARRRGQLKLDRENAALTAAGQQPRQKKFETVKDTLRKQISSVLYRTTSFEEFSDRLMQQYGIAVKESRGQLKLCAVIDNILLNENPVDFEIFLQKLEQQGYEIKRGKHTSVKGARQKRFIRFRTLGAGYSEDEIKAVIAGEAEHRPHQKQPPKEQPFHLLVDIQAKLSEGKSEGYARWVKRYNLKEMSKTLIFLQENKIGSIEEMQERVDAATAHYHELGDSIKAAEKRLAEITVLKAHIINYAKTRPVYDAYRKTGYSKHFLETHRTEITLHKAAKAAFNESNLKTLPKVKELDVEYSKLLTEKKARYPDYRKAKEEMQEFLRAKRNVELFFAEEKSSAEKMKSR